MKLRVNDQVIITTPNTEATMSIISDFLIKQLDLSMLPINSIKVQVLNNITTMIGIVNKPFLKI